jgi:GAF domain-containing protein
MTAQIKNLISELEQQIRALKMSTEVSRRLSTILERDRLISAVVDQLQSAFGYYHVHIYLFDDARQNLVMTSGAGEPGRIMREREHTIPLGKGLVGRAAATNQGILASDTSQEPDWLPNELLPETRAEAALPIAIGNTVLGVLDVQENTVGGLTEDDQELLQAIASQVAIAVQNAQSYEQARRQAEHESRITTISQRIRAATTIDEVLQITITELGQIFGAQQAAAELQIDKKNGVDTRPRRNE